MRRLHKLTQLLFHLFGGRADIEDILGDLDEVYYSSKERSNTVVALWHYWRHVFSLLLSYSLRRRAKDAAYSPYYRGPNVSIMKSYLKVSIRNLKQQKTFTVLNVLGLSTGMSIALLALAMFIELQNFDTFHPHAAEIYQLNTKVIKDGNTEVFASTPPALTYAADAQVTDLKNSVHINDDFFPVVKKAGNELRLRGLFTSPDFFNVFAMPLKEGSTISLSEPGNVIITEELATRLFGEDTALGKVIETENWGSLQVSGVMQTYPKRTHLRFEILTGFETSPSFDARYKNARWTNFRSNYYYLRVADDKKALAMNQIEQLALQGKSAMAQENLSAAYQLRPLTTINPGTTMEDEFGLVFDQQTMWFFFGIALLILLPACFNYSNLSITRALKRAKEIGIRKVIGSQKKQIVEQFLVETVLVSLISVVLATVLFHLIRAEFISMLVGASALSFEITPSLLGVFGAFALITGIFTGIIPAAYFAKISPLAAMKNGIEAGKVSISGLRKGLLVVQFSLTLGFMMGIGVLAKQYFTVLNYQTGFNKENILVLTLEDHHPEIVRNTFLSMPEVGEVSFSSSIPGTLC
ncbi:MAG: ABC transporter permease [Bacteroidota bacterium]